MDRAQEATSGPSPDQVDQVDHYMVRVSRRGADGQRISGLVERLGSDEKRRFADAGELLRLLTAWFGDEE